MKIMKRDSITGELEDLKRIVTSLRSGTDDQAAAILARLRLGDTPEDVAKSLSLVPSPAASTQPPRYASLCYSFLYSCKKTKQRHNGNRSSAYWARSPPIPLEVQ